MIHIRFIDSSANEFRVAVAPRVPVRKVAKTVFGETGIPPSHQIWKISLEGKTVEPRNWLHEKVGSILSDGDVVQVLSKKEDPERFWEAALTTSNLPAVRRLIEEGYPLPRDWLDYARDGSKKMLELIFESMMYEDPIHHRSPFWSPEIDGLVRAGQIEDAMFHPLRFCTGYLPKNTLSMLTEIGKENLHRTEGY